MLNALSGRSGLGFLTVSVAGALAAVAYFRMRKKRFKDQRVTFDPTTEQEKIEIKGLCSEIKAHRIWDKGRDV